MLRRTFFPLLASFFCTAPAQAKPPQPNPEPLHMTASELAATPTTAYIFKRAQDPLFPAFQYSRGTELSHTEMDFLFSQARLRQRMLSVAEVSALLGRPC